MKYNIIIIFLFVATTAVAQKAPRTKSAGALCDSVQFYYTAGSSTHSSIITTYRWSRAAVAGIANPAANANSGIINEYLDNTTPYSILVKYAITLTANGCDHTDTLELTIYPTPHLNSTLTPPAICDSTAFNYTATTLTPGTSFSWTRPAVAGIVNPSATGSGNVISEVLVNNTNADITVKYGIRMVANGCVQTDTIAVVVHPTPFLVKNHNRKNITDQLPELNKVWAVKRKEELVLVFS